MISFSSKVNVWEQAGFCGKWISPLSKLPMDQDPWENPDKSYRALMRELEAQGFFYGSWVRMNFHAGTWPHQSSRHERHPHAAPALNSGGFELIMSNPWLEIREETTPLIFDLLSCAKCSILLQHLPQEDNFSSVLFVLLVLRKIMTSFRCDGNKLVPVVQCTRMIQCTPFWINTHSSWLSWFMFLVIWLVLVT